MADKTASYPGKSVYDNCAHIKESGFDILIAKKTFKVNTHGGLTVTIPKDATLKDLGLIENGYQALATNNTWDDVNNDGKPDHIYVVDFKIFAILTK